MLYGPSVPSQCVTVTVPYKLFCHTGKCRAVTIRRADIVRARAKIQSASGFAVPTHWASVPYLADQGEPLL